MEPAKPAFQLHPRRQIIIVRMVDGSKDEDDNVDCKHMFDQFQMFYKLALDFKFRGGAVL